MRVDVHGPTGLAKRYQTSAPLNSNSYPKPARQHRNQKPDGQTKSDARSDEFHANGGTMFKCSNNVQVTAVGFEPTPLRTGAWSQRLRPLGQTVMSASHIIMTIDTNCRIDPIQSHAINLLPNRLHVQTLSSVDFHDDVSCTHDSLAERSKALAQGASPKGRGFEPHSCHLALS